MEARGAGAACCHGDRRASLRRAHGPLSAGRCLSALRCKDLSKTTWSRLRLIFQPHAEFILRESDTDSVKEGTELLEGEVALCTFQKRADDSRT